MFDAMVWKPLVSALFVLPCFAFAASQFGDASHQVIRLWEGKAPGALGDRPQDVPTLTVFLPDPSKVTGAAMVICPGGGYAGLAEHEGAPYAAFLNAQGITCFVLKYRLGSEGYRHPVELGDVARAVRTVRHRAAEWAVDTKRIGVMGSSAGGHLASTLATHFDPGNPQAADLVDRESSRPDMAVLVYPVITMGPQTNEFSRDMLLGKNPSRKLIQELSNELHVTAQTPPCFLFHTWEDQAVPVENVLMFAEALARNKVPFALHIFEKGGHGMGLGGYAEGKAPIHPWTNDLGFWLRENGWAK